MNIMKLIEKYGKENLLFIVPMRPIRTILFISYTSSDDEPVEVPAKITEKRYKLENNYKITLQSVYEGFGQRHFYISDLNSLIKKGIVKVYVDVSKEME